MAWDSVHLFECPTRVHYGAGAIAGLPDAPRRARPAARRAGLRPGPAGRRDRRPGARARRRRPASPSTRYTDTAENPTTTNLDEIVALYRAQGCDGIVGLGGGSSLDAAKAASALIENGGTRLGLPRARPRAAPRAARDLHSRRPAARAPRSRSSSSSPIPDEHFKVVCASRNLAATIAIVDPSSC